MSFDFTACSAGTAVARLESEDGLELASLSISVQESASEPASALEKLFPPSATFTESESPPSATFAESESPSTAIGSSSLDLPLPPDPSNLSMTVIDDSDLLISVDAMSGIEKYEFGGRYRSLTSSEWDGWSYVHLPPSWPPDEPSEDVTCGIYEIKLRAKGDGITYRAD